MNKLILSILLFSTQSFAGGIETCEPTVIYKDRIKEVEKEVYFFTETIKRVDVTRKNRLSLLGGTGPSSDLDIEQFGITTQVRRPSETLVGLSYSRDVGKRLVFSAIILNNDTALIGLGVSW
jgi:hypothetical protein